MNKRIGVYGASGCGRGIMPFLRDQYASDDLVFIDDGISPPEVNGHSVLNWEEFLTSSWNEKHVSLAIAAPRTRSRLAEKCISANVSFVEARASSVVEMDASYIGVGACLSPFVTIGSNVSIGICFHANLYSYVEHDARIGDFVTLAPGAKINGNVTIGDGAYIGSGAVVRQGISIGQNAVVGMGAVVTRDVVAAETVVGNPARPLLKV